METKRERHHDLDWLRVIAIIILLYFHTGMIFVSWGWHITNSETSKFLEYIMGWLHNWRMPLLLFISGAGTYFALGFRSPKKFLKERHKRLLIPLLMGILLIVPPQIYIERISQFASYFEFYPTIFQFVAYPAGNFSWHHLWFIMYLLVYSVIGLPFFLYLRSEKSQKTRDFISNLLTKKGGFSFVFIPMIMFQFILMPFFPYETHALIDDWGYFVYYFLFFLFGYIIYSDKRNWLQLKKQRKIYLILAILSLIPFYSAWLIPYNISFYRYDFIFKIASAIVTWYWVLAIIGYGQKYLNKKSKVLSYANEAIYPFYILHQTAIVVIGYYVIQWNFGISMKFLIISTLSLVSSMLIYYILISPFNLFRILFGMKALVKNNSYNKEIILKEVLIQDEA